MLDWLTGRIMLPPEGSAYAGEVDTVFLGLYWLSQVLFWGITIAAIYFAWKYKYKAGRRTPHQTHNTNLEVIWSVGPTLLCVGIFFWGLNGYMKYAVAPGDAMEIVVTGKQWLWQFEYPDGSRTVNDLHVPVNTPIRLVMTSEDVLHDFFIPDMRIKHDVVPGRYTSIWFTPNSVGTHHFTCAEYCGRDHSGMQGEMTVESAEDFAVFQATGGTEFEEYFNGESGTPGRLGRDPVSAQGLLVVPFGGRQRGQRSDLAGTCTARRWNWRTARRHRRRAYLGTFHDAAERAGGERVRPDHADVPRAVAGA